MSNSCCMWFSCQCFVSFPFHLTCCHIQSSLGSNLQSWRFFGLFPLAVNLGLHTAMSVVLCQDWLSVSQLQHSFRCLLSMLVLAKVCWRMLGGNVGIFLAQCKRNNWLILLHFLVTLWGHHMDWLRFLQLLLEDSENKEIWHVSAAYWLPQL